jgi:DNA invertase Pin-like site-specific DNA recombinase
MTNTEEKNKIPVVAYIRAASAEEGGEIDSIAKQILCVEKYASENRLKIEKHYIDAGVRGNTLDRQALKELGRETKNANWKMVIVFSWDRITLNYWEFVALRKEFEKRGVKIQSIHMIDPSDNM